MPELKMELQIKDSELFSDLCKTLEDTVELLDDYKQSGMTPKEVQTCLNDLKSSLKFLLE